MAIGVLSILDGSGWDDAKVEVWERLIAPLAAPAAACEASRRLIATTPAHRWDFSTWKSWYDAVVRAEEIDRPALQPGYDTVTLDEHLVWLTDRAANAVTAHAREQAAIELDVWARYRAGLMFDTMKGI